MAALEARGVSVAQTVGGAEPPRLLAATAVATGGGEHDGANVAEVRFLLRRLFARFVVHDSGDAGVAIVPALRADALEELMATLNATKRQALRLTTDANGLPTTWVIARIAARAR